MPVASARASSRSELMVDRDPTTGELAVLLERILIQLGDVATKEFVQTKFDGFNDRVKRLEQDHTAWVRTSTEAHVELDRDSKARHAETKSEMIQLEARLRAAMEKKHAESTAAIAEVVTDQKADQKDLKSVRNSRVTAWIGIGLAWLGSLTLFFFRGGQS